MAPAQAPDSLTFSPPFGPPFPFLSMGMNLADGGVHHGLVHMRILGNAIEYPFENTMFDPNDRTA